MRALLSPLTSSERRAEAPATSEGERFFGSFRGEDGRGWLLKIVRNACLDLRHRERHASMTGDFDETMVGSEQVAASAVIAWAGAVSGGPGSAMGQVRAGSRAA